MALDKIKIAGYCRNISAFFLCSLVFFLPISKAAIEVCVYNAIGFYLIAKLIIRQGLPKTGLNPAIFAYLGACFLSIFLSSNFAISAHNFPGKILKHVVLFFVIADTLHTKERARNLLFVFFLSALILGVDGIYQHFTHRDFIRNRAYYDIPRIHASFSNPNGFGCYLSVAITFAAGYIFNPQTKRMLRFLLAGLVILLAICLLLTFSRGAWMSMIVSLVFLSLWIKALGLTLLALALLLFTFRQAYLPYLKNYLSNFHIGTYYVGDYSNFLGFKGIDPDRQLIWQAAWKMFMHRPWIGLGLGTFMFNFKKFVAPGYIHGTPYAHNCYLQVAAELGVVGLGSFLLILGLFFYHGIQALKACEKNFSWYILLTCLAALLGYSAQMAVDTTLYALDLGALFWIILGLGCAQMRSLKLAAGEK